MNNKLILVLSAVSLSLSACGGKKPITPTKTEYRVVMPESKYFNCKEVPLPDPENLSDVQVSMLINDLVLMNRLCANNSSAIKEYLEKAKEELEKRNSSD